MNDRSFPEPLLDPSALIVDLVGCSAVPDFDTPEYVQFGSLSTRKWETTEGMDPFSFGFNNATDPADYSNATTIIQRLIDVVSKNGN